MTTTKNKEKSARIVAAKAVVERMRAMHPAAFPLALRPLKVGIREDLIAAGWQTDEVTLALAFYVNTSSYIEATLQDGAFRIDLNGCPTSPVQPHETGWLRHVAEGRAGYIPAPDIE